MTRILIALAVLLAVEPVVSALPPEGPSGEMVLLRDKVSQTLLKYCRASDPHRRLVLINEVAAIRDPRVAVALGEALSDPDDELRMQAAFSIVHHQTEDLINKMMTGRSALRWARQWWTENEADLRRRAKRLR